VTMWSIAALTGPVHARGPKANRIDPDVETHRVKDEDLANANPVPLPTARSVLVRLRGHKANGIDLDVETHRVKDEDLANANPVPFPTARSTLVCLKHAIVTCA